MARKKASEKTSEKTSGKSSKSKKTIELTFAPIMSAATEFSVLLRKKEVKKVGGREHTTISPRIEGLPIDFIVKKGEVVEVTEAQYEELKEIGAAESEEEYKKRTKFINDMSAQHPENLTWDMIVAEGGNWSTLADSQHIVYNDRLLRV